nr:class II fumarate hydratase [Gammaproteobacteria bacterium]
MEYRVERDTMGEVQVPANRLWGAQTERSYQNFKIGSERMPLQLIHAFARLKKACAIVNHALGKLDKEKVTAIAQACEEILEGRHDQEFPLSVWQTGSGTQSNMNCNEVIANRATQILGGDFAKKKLIHPNDHVNMSQSSNDTFPTAMHISAVMAVEDELFPALEKLRQTLHSKAEQFTEIVKIGRTHLQDATPLTLGQEISGWVAMLETNRTQLKEVLTHIRELAIGGTAVGTGLNAHPEFSERVAAAVASDTGKQFASAS